MAAAEGRTINVVIPDGDPDSVRAVKQGIEEALSKFKDAQGLIYVNIENLVLHPSGGHHGPPGHPPHFGRGKHRSGRRSRSRSRSHSRSHSRGRSGHKGGKHHHGRRHSRGRYHDYYRHHSPSRSQSVTENTSADDTGVEGHEVPPCWAVWDKKQWKKAKKHWRGRSRSRSRSRSNGRNGHHGKQFKKNKCQKCNSGDKEPVTTGEVVDSTEQNKDNVEKRTNDDLQEKFDSMNVQSP